MSGGKGEFTTMDGTERLSAPVPAPKQSKPWGVVFYFSLLTCVSVVAFILGCYATDRVLHLDIPVVPAAEQAVLVSNPKLVPDGYSVYSLGTGAGYWAASKDMLYTRSDHGVISWGKWAYLVGGLSADQTSAGTNNTVLDAVVRYDMETGLSEQLASMPEPRYRFAYALLDNKIYVAGGAATADGDATDTVFVMDLLANNQFGSWNRTGRLTMPRIDACGGAVNGKVYVMGGYDPANNWVPTASAEVLDPATATATAAPVWAAAPSMSSPRGDCRAASVNGLLYAVGGVAQPDPTGPYVFLCSVEVFDPAANAWSARASMANPRGDFGIEVLPGGRIIVAGGERTNGTATQIAMYEVEEYVIADDIWVRKAPLAQARFRSDLAYTAGRVYVFGGQPACGLTGTAADACFNVVLKSVYAYFDVPYPRLYAFYKAPGNETTSASGGVVSTPARRLLRSLF